MMIIRNLEKKDAPAVAPLIFQLTKNIVEPEKLVARIEALAGASDCCFLVAESNGTLAGFGGLVWYIIPSKGLVGWLEEIIVDEAARRQGIAKALVHELLKIATQKNVKIMKLTSTGPAASNLYQKFGFTKKDQEYFFKKMG